MTKRLAVFSVVLVAFLFSGRPAAATVIGIGGFVSPTLLDFNDAPNSAIGGFYSGLTFVELFGGSTYNTGTGGGASEVASNFCLNVCAPQSSTFLPGEILFSGPVHRVGFFITTNSADNTTVSAYLGAVLVGSHVFDTGGAGIGGSFAGVEFLGGFDRLVIDPANASNGALSIDDLRYESVPEPTTMLLLGAGLAAAGLRRAPRRRSEAD